jgi:Domain of unknown function (DUF4192)
MTTSTPHTHIRLRDLSELVAGIPYLIGFPPMNSLVLFTFRRCPDLVLSTTIRVDLPKPEHVPLLVAELVMAVARNDAVAVIAVVVGEDGAEHACLVDVLRNTLANKDILLTHASWVPKVAHGELWQCYDDPLCTDTVPDPQSSALAAATAVAGETTYANREAMAAHLAPDPEEALTRRRKLLDAYQMIPRQPYTDADLQVDLGLLGDVLDRTRSSYDPPTLTDLQMVRLARALTQPPVKDECLAIALSDSSESAERLWGVLVRGLPAPERAEPAFLLAMSTYLRGAGVLAGLALKIVTESDPLHDTAVLLDLALRMGVPPEHLRGLLVASILRKNEEQTDDEDDPPLDTTPETSTSEPTDPSQRGQGPEPREPSPGQPGFAACGCEEPTRSPATLVVIDDGLAFGPWRPAQTAAPGQAPVVEPPRMAPGPLSEEAAAALGIHVDAPVRRTVTMDALTAFLPPPTEQRGPG